MSPCGQYGMPWMSLFLATTYDILNNWKLVVEWDYEWTLGLHGNKQFTHVRWWMLLKIWESHRNFCHCMVVHIVWSNKWGHFFFIVLWISMFVVLVVWFLASWRSFQGLFVFRLMWLSLTMWVFVWWLVFLGCVCYASNCKASRHPYIGVFFFFSLLASFAWQKAWWHLRYKQSYN